ncbi:MAG TPA: TonB-dependent receptor, partial [Bryobacteraceae bacterium]|nr:TonB-dependent receptor [Bryobacteraceae bacterium]
MHISALLFAVLSLLPPLAFAQIGGTGSIQGTVTDPSAAIVPGAVVSATNVATGLKVTRETSAAGVYVIAALPPGTYTIDVSAPGFQPVRQENVTVDALSTVGLNLTLQVGTSTEAVTVTAAATPLNTEDARMGQTMRNEMYTALPLSMGVSGIGAGPRNAGAFIYLMPGVQEGNRWGTVNGSQGFSKDVYIEGVPITDPIQQGEGRAVNLGVSVDAVEQFQVETSGTGVEFNGQGSENYVIKSGTNEFHGTLFEYFRNTVLDARSFFAARRPKQNQNEFGGTFGGPIVRNKLFFFGVYDGWRYRVQTSPSFLTVPTVRMRQGDFSELLPVQIFDPLTTQALPGGGFTRDPFPGNIIPANRLSSISKFLQQPLPDPTRGGVANNYLGQLPVGYNNDNFTFKTDYNMTPVQRLSFLFTKGKRGQSGPYREVTVPIPLPYTNTREVVERPTVAQIKHTWSATSTTVNVFSFGFNRLFVPITNVTSEGQWATKAGIRGLPAGEASNSFPEASFAGPNAPANWRGTDARDFEDVNNSFTLQDSFNWLKGKHSLKFGFQHQRLQDNVATEDTGTLFNSAFSNVNTAGFNANGALNAASGHAYASYLLGAVNSATVLDNAVVRLGVRFRSNSMWVQDDFKVLPNLTFNLGLRYDLFDPYEEVADRFSYLDPNAPNPAIGGFPGALRFGGNYAPGDLSCNCSGVVNKYYGAVGPRLGAAWSVTSNTVIRAAWGVMYTRRGAVGGREGARGGTGLLGINASAPLSAPDTFTPSFFWENGIPAYAKGPVYNAAYGTGFATGLGSGNGVTYGEPDSKPPRYQNWNFSIQRAITPSTALTLAYVGSNGKSLAGAGRGIWSNQIHPKYLALGTLLQSNVTPQVITQAQARFPEIRLPYANFSGNLGQMLRPFPQYPSVSDPFGNDGQSNYNAFQMIVNQRLAHGVTFMFNYTFSKSINNVSGGRSAYEWSDAKTISNVDQPHILNALFTYDLPWGKGRAFRPGGITGALVNDWKISGITKFASGTPLGAIGAACTLPNAGGCMASYNPNFSGPVRINGEWGAGDLLGSNPPS